MEKGRLLIGGTNDGMRIRSNLFVIELPMLTGSSEIYQEFQEIEIYRLEYLVSDNKKYEFYLLDGLTAGDLIEKLKSGDYQVEGLIIN